MKMDAFCTYGVPALAVSVLATAAACSAPDASARVDPIGPDRASFAHVAPVLARRCGSIDCHGSAFRNMRVYGYGGQRLGAATSPDVPNSITPEEANATYDSVIGLEPELMREVVQGGGAGAEHLTFVRKGRGEEEHKGGRRITRGDDSDTCIQSWLSNNVKIEACNRAGCVIDPEDAGSTKIGQCL